MTANETSPGTYADPPAARRPPVPGLVTAGACAASAGIHLGLAPAHLRESGPLAASFVLAAVLLLWLALRIVAAPDDAPTRRRAAAGLAFLGLCYVASRTTGVPVLVPRPEPLDGLGAVTQAIQLLGALAAFRTSRQPALDGSALGKDPA